jgi:hypothetical protein
VSSATDTEKSDRIISSWRLLDFHVVYKVPVVDTEVDPPQPNPLKGMRTQGVDVRSAAVGKDSLRKNESLDQGD